MNPINNKLLFITVLTLYMMYVSCTKKPDIEYTSTYKMSGEWFTQYYTDGTPVTEHHRMLTYNTSDPNSGKIWLDDQGVWPFRSKLDVDYSNLSFKPMDSTDNLEATGETVKIYEGKVIPDGGHSKTGVVVDSIYLKVEFSDDPGTIYEIRGHYRTGFFEDEYH